MCPGLSLYVVQPFKMFYTEEYMWDQDFTNKLFDVAKNLTLDWFHLSRNVESVIKVRSISMFWKQFIWIKLHKSNVWQINSDIWRRGLVPCSTLPRRACYGRMTEHMLCKGFNISRVRYEKCISLNSKCSIGEGWREQGQRGRRWRENRAEKNGSCLTSFYNLSLQGNAVPISWHCRVNFV